MSQPKKKKNQSLKNQVSRIVKNEILKNAEIKHFQVITTSAGVDYDGTITTRTAMAQGDTDITRDGDAIRLQKFELRFDILANTLVALFRIIIFQWHTSTNQLAPTIGQILNINGGQAEAIHSPYNPDYYQTFTVLYDHTMQVDTNGTIGQGIFMRTGYVKLTNFKQNANFIAGATTGTNQIHMLVLSDRVSTNLPLFRAVSWVTYTDS